MSGSAYAMALPRNSVGNRQMKDNAIKSVEVANGTLTKADMKAGTIPKIPAIPRQVAKYWAMVQANGSIHRQSGGISSTLGQSSQYRLTFPSDITGCGYQATAGDPGAMGNLEYVIPRVMAAARSTIDNRTIVVQNYFPDATTNDNWFPTTGDFFVTVFC